MCSPFLFYRQLRALQALAGGYYCFALRAFFGFRNRKEIQLLLPMAGRRRYTANGGTPSLHRQRRDAVATPPTA
ncbi:MAG: hypothetical protein IKZ84_18925 [Victivallales bacterium]|nr:hypothetical protein [Victivallales bacterium]